MADELKIDASVLFSKGDRIVSNNDVGPLHIDVSGVKAADFEQVIGLVEEALSLGDIGAGGFCYLLNQSTVGTVTVRPGTGALDLIELKPGDPALFRLKATAPYAISTIAACTLRIILIEA